MEENEHINKHLKNSLDGYNVSPRISSFDDILLKMKKKKRRRFLIFFFPGLIFWIGGTLVLTHYTGLTENIKQQTHASVSENKNTNNANTEHNSFRGKNNSAPDPFAAPASPLPSGKVVTQKVNPAILPGDTTNKLHLPRQDFAFVQTHSSLPEKPLTQKREQHLLPGSVTDTFPATENSQGKNTGLAKNEWQKEVSGSTDLVVLKVSDTLNADFLEPHSIPLQYDQSQPEILIIPLTEQKTALALKDTIKKQKPCRWFAGIDFIPQAGAYQFSENKKSDATFDNTGGGFSESYLAYKKEQNPIMFNYSFGLKMGMMVKENWEILLGFGFQKYKQKENTSRLPVYSSPATASPGIVPNQGFASNTLDSKDSPTNLYRYLQYSLEAAHYFDMNSFTRIKVGVGFQVNRVVVSKSFVVTGPGMYSENYSLTGKPLNTLNYLMNVKIGFVQDLSSKIQFQLCPTLYYSLNSMFVSDYIIKQKNYGCGLQCLLLFKIR